MALGSTMAEAREALAVRLSVEALAHCERVSETAAALAARFGVDVECARLAGLLHDWGRDLSDEQLLRAAADHGIPVTEADRSVPYLLHGEVAAAELRGAFPALSEEVVRAVACHTFGCVPTTDLVKVIYVADSIEPARTGKRIEALRRMATEATLDETFVAVYADSLASIVERRRPLHPTTVAVWNAAIAGAVT